MHYFIFTEDDYDYCRIQGLYSCDKPVSRVEWENFSKDNCQRLFDKEQELILKWYHRVGYGIGWQGCSDEPKGPVCVIYRCQAEFEKSPEGKELDDFQKANRTLDLFVKQYGLVELEYQHF